MPNHSTTYRECEYGCCLQRGRHPHINHVAAIFVILDFQSDSVYRIHTQEAEGAPQENIAKGVELKAKRAHTRKMIKWF